jgi:hypothetical protein
MKAEKPQVLGLSDKDIVQRFIFTYLIYDLFGEEMCCDSSGGVSFDCRNYA